MKTTRPPRFAVVYVAPRHRMSILRPWYVAEIHDSGRYYVVVGHVDGYEHEHEAQEARTALVKNARRLGWGRALAAMGRGVK